MATTLNAATLLAVPLAPLAGAVLAGVFGTTLGGNVIGRRLSHTFTILGVLIAFILSAMTLKSVAIDGARFNETLYEWMVVGGLRMEVGFLVDGLTAMMMCVVTFVSLMVHIYTIGYMEEDPGYNRFFAYISLFTFSMLMLVMANNFLQLFFGWEAVGLVSYLLIGFWYTRPTAIFANLKAFLVNRVGDFGFILGIGLIAAYAGTLNYAEAFDRFSAGGPETYYAQRYTVDFVGRLDPRDLATRFERSARRKTMGNWELYGDFYRSLCEMQPESLPHIFVETFAQQYEQAARETPPLAMAGTPSGGFRNQRLLEKSACGSEE
mgnify:CR=1 FL=1